MNVKVLVHGCCDAARANGVVREYNLVFLLDAQILTRAAHGYRIGIPYDIVKTFTV